MKRHLNSQFRLHSSSLLPYCCWLQNGRDIYSSFCACKNVGPPLQHGRFIEEVSSWSAWRRWSQRIATMGNACKSYYELIEELRIKLERRKRLEPINDCDCMRSKYTVIENLSVLSFEIMDSVSETLRPIQHSWSRKRNLALSVLAKYNLGKSC